MIHRRGFLLGMLAAPAIIRMPGILMPVKAMTIDEWITKTLEDVIYRIEPTDTPLLDAIVRANRAPAWPSDFLEWAI